jgi:hypothetical protein
MALVYADRVVEESATTGTGTLSLNGAQTGYQSFVAGVGDGNTCYYTVTDQTDWEVGLGTVTAGTPDTLSRDTVYASSNADALVDFTGLLTVFLGVPASIFDTFSVDGHEHAGEDITSGTIAVARLPVMVGDSGSGGTAGLVPAPASGDAAAGLFFKADGTWAVPTASAGAGGNDTEIQFNSAGSLAGISGFTFNSGTSTISLGSGFTLNTSSGTLIPGTLSTVDINGGTIDGTSLGGAVPCTGVRTQNLAIDNGTTNAGSWSISGTTMLQYVAGDATFRYFRIKPNAAGDYYFQIDADTGEYYFGGNDFKINGTTRVFDMGAVNIDSGTIDNTTLGATTPASGRFTSLRQDSYLDAAVVSTPSTPGSGFVRIFSKNDATGDRMWTLDTYGTARKIYASTDGMVDSDDVSLPAVSGATYDTLTDHISLCESSGAISGGVISQSGTGLIDVSAGTGKLRSSASSSAPLYFCDFSASTGISIPAGTNRFIGVEYNSGSPQVTVRTTDDFNGQTDYRLGVVTYQDGELHITQGCCQILDSPILGLRRANAVDPLAYDVSVGGLRVTDAGSRTLALSAGRLWLGYHPVAIAAVDTSGSDTMATYYGTVQDSATATTWNNTQYNNSGTLTAIANNKYGIHWIYVETDGDLVLVYGESESDSIVAAAEVSPPVTLPARLVSHGKLIARLIFQKDGTAPERIDSFLQTLPAGSGGGGSGDMLKSIYDTDNDGRVDVAESLGDGTYTVTAAEASATADDAAQALADAATAQSTANGAIPYAGQSFGTWTGGLYLGTSWAEIDTSLRFTVPQTGSYLFMASLRVSPSRDTPNAYAKARYYNVTTATVYTNSTTLIQDDTGTYARTGTERTVMILASAAANDVITLQGFASVASEIQITANPDGVNKSIYVRVTT